VVSRACYGRICVAVGPPLSTAKPQQPRDPTPRVLAARGPWAPPAALHEFLAGQRQLGLDRPAVADLLAGLEARGLVAGTAPDAGGPARLTAEDTALHTRLAEAVAPRTKQLFAGFDPDDLATAHRVLAQVVERADHLAANLQAGLLT
jgi:hypothetical protein